MRSLLFVAAFLTLAFTADKPAYRLYNQKLKSAKYSALLKQAANADVVLFGELHDNPICHWLEIQLTKDLYEQKQKNLVLGAEMFEADNQTVYSDYLAKRVTEKQLPQQARLWTNFETDYKPFLDFARAHNLPMIATNVPRRYASMVSRRGLVSLDSLSVEEKKYLAPLPITVDLALPGYKEMLSMGDMHTPTGDMTAANVARAQGIKDATMAYFILQNLKPGNTFLHLNGSYHSDNFEGIVWYLKQKNPGLKIVTISSVEEPNPDKPSEAKAGTATFTVCIPDDMTKTY